MSGAMRKVGVYLGLLEDNDRYDDEADVYDDDAEPEMSRSPARAQRGRGDGRPARPSDAPRTLVGPSAEPSSPASPPCTRAPTTRRAPSASTSARACR